MPRGQEKLSSGDIPQADSLDSVRKIIHVISTGVQKSVEIEMVTGVSGRHVRYRIQTAKILGLVTGDLSLTSLARKLIQAESGSEEEKMLWRTAIASSKVFHLVPTLFQKNPIDTDTIARKFVRFANLSPATAERRARVLRSWGNQVRAEEKK
jgi:hypothetical protein